MNIYMYTYTHTYNVQKGSRDRVRAHTTLTD